MKFLIPPGGGSDFVIRRLIPFVANVMLGIGIKYLLERSASDKSSDDILWVVKGMGTLLVVFILVLMVLTATIREYIDDVRKQQAYRVSVHENLKGIHGRKTAFDFCAAIAHQAKKSIVIIGPHFQQGSAPLPTHDQYLNEGLEKAIQRGEDPSHGTFSYHRIVQLDEAQYRRIDNGKVDAAVIGNDALASHLKKCLESNKESRSLDVVVCGKIAVPSFPSLMIVDERYVFFSLPTEQWNRKDSNENPEGVIEKSLDFDFVLSIEDATGEIPRAFMQIATQFRIESRPITSIQKNIKHESDGGPKVTTSG